MDIGTDKIKPEAMQGVPHHLIDIIDPKEDFNVFIFQKLVKDAIKDVASRGHLPIIVGGTGFYIQAVLYDIDFTETDEDMTLRRQLEERARTEGVHVLHQELAQVDPESARIIHENNSKRVIRALEYYKKTGRPISEHNSEQRSAESPYDSRYFVLNDKRENLYERIDKRVDEMIEEGLEEEVRSLLPLNIPRTATSMQGLGYREMLGYIDGEYDLERAVYLIKRNTRHFAKRQLTWFRRERNVIWIDKDRFDYDNELILKEMLKYYEH
jgi:tRNA dimethylallyltransferase